jgi:hypothetical protein
MIVIEPNGNAQAWPVYDQPDLFLRLGNLLEDPVTAIWGRYPYKANHAYPGDKPDVTQFPAMVDQLRGQYEAICAAAAAAPAADMTVVFDAGGSAGHLMSHARSHRHARAA